MHPFVLKDLYDECNAMQPTQHGDSYRSAFEEGKRWVFLHIFHKMKPEKMTFEEERRKLMELEEIRDE